ncbi:hypothetical protein [Amycolatopsis sp. cmx-4-83]|uniref:hypothetical protein n=1 Tax=Amycolatopsis sp. cmx-4-83 TaxID=2790940 RepID=UPI003979DCAA
MVWTEFTGLILVNVSDEPPVQVASTIPLKSGLEAVAVGGLEVIGAVSLGSVFVRELLPQPAVSSTTAVNEAVARTQSELWGSSRFPQFSCTRASSLCVLGRRPSRDRYSVAENTGAEA